MSDGWRDLVLIVLMLGGALLVGLVAIRLLAPVVAAHVVP
jgi:hypothetical protein